METVTIALLLSILGSVISVLNLIFNRKDKSNKDGENDGYKWGQIDAKLASIEKTLSKIEEKFDTYDTEIDARIEKAIKQHIAIYHKKG